MFETAGLRDIPPGPALMAALADADPTTLDEVRALEYAAAMEKLKSYCDATRLEALAAYSQANTDVPASLVPGGARLISVGGPGTPAIDEFCVDEYAATARRQHGSARLHLGLALDLKHRLPHVLAMLKTGRIAVWRARLVAEATRHLSVAQVAIAQARILPVLGGLGPKRLAEIVAQVVIDTDPDAADKAADKAAERRHVTLDQSDDHGMVSGAFTADPGDARRFDASIDQIATWLGQLGDTSPIQVRRAKALGILANPHAALALMSRATGATGGSGLAEASTGPWPEATLYIHVTRDQWEQTRSGAATLEGVGPITLNQAKHVLGHAQVTVKPVIDLDDMPTSDDRFARGGLREAVVLKNPHCPFPYCSRCSRKNQADHTVAWPKGKTCIDNLSPPDVGHHRAKTHAGWQLRQVYNGIYVWKSPHGRIYVLDHRGITQDIGLPPTG